jgi:hypothetical protein
MSVSKDDGTTMDYVENILEFRVVEPVIKRAVKWNDPYRGLTVMKSDWTVN